MGSPRRRNQDCRFACGGPAFCRQALVSVVNLFQSVVPSFHKRFGRKLILFFVLSDFLYMVRTDAENGIIMVESSVAIDHVRAHYSMKNVNIMHIINRTFDMELIEVRHGHYHRPAIDNAHK